MIKIGQYPSYTDISLGDMNKYKSILGDKFTEYKKGIGLFSHDIGIGSFVYLRRILERLVFDKYEEVSEELSIDKENFYKSKFIDKIELLKDYLPDTLVNNKNVYGIVSLGIHELDEADCTNMFPYIKAGIELILDDLIKDKERREKEKLFSNFVSQKTSELKGKDQNK